MGCLLAEFKLTAMEAEWRVPVLLVCSLLHSLFPIPSLPFSVSQVNFFIYFFFQVQCQVVSFPLDLERFQRSAT